VAPDHPKIKGVYKVFEKIATHFSSDRNPALLGRRLKYR
jgi:hypothetical protein